MKKRILTLLLSLCFILSLLPAAAFADGEIYVALGDSITTGYGLSNKETECFAKLVANENNYTLTNAAVDGATSAELLAFVQDSANSSLLSGADLITITIGGNDLLGALYEYLAAAWNNDYPDTPKDAEDIKAMLASGDIASLSGMIEYFPNFGYSSEANNASINVWINLENTITAIKEINPDVTIIVANQYNPYAYLPTLVAGNQLLTAFSEQIQAIVDAFEDGAARLNQSVSSVNDYLDFYVADVYNAFKNPAQNPCNASISLTSSFELDFNPDIHPNAYGHTLIAEAIKDTLGSLLTGNEGEPQVNSLWVNGRNVLKTGNYTVPCGEGTAVYDAGSNTLTLRNATITKSSSNNSSAYSGIYVEGNLTIVLDGASQISGALNYGIYSRYGFLTIKGTSRSDSLTIGSADVDTGSPYFGIHLSNGLDISISDCTVAAYGIFGGIVSYSSDLYITDSTVTAKCGVNGTWCGICTGNVCIDDSSSVTAISENSLQLGIYAMIGFITVGGAQYICNASEVQIVNGEAVKGLHRPGVYVNGVFLDSTNKSTECGEGTAEYDFDSNTLTLTNAEITECSYYAAVYGTCGIYAEGDLKLVLVGENSVASDAETGIYSNGELAISGSGSLSLTADSGESPTCIYANSVVINGGSLSLAVESNSAGIYTGTLTVNGGSVKINLSGPGDSYRAISADYGLSIKGGEVSVQISEDYSPFNFINGVVCSYYGDIDISGGTVNVSFADVSEISAIYSGDKVVISGGVVTLNSSIIGQTVEITGEPTIQIDAPDGVEGLEADDAAVTVNGVEYAYVESSLLIRDGVVIYGMSQAETGPDVPAVVPPSDTETEYAPDGSVMTTTTKPDGSSVVRVTAPDGSSSVTNIDKDGQSKTEASLSKSAAAQDGVVSLPMPGVSASDKLADAPAVTLDLPGYGSVKVEIPVENVTAGTVAVLMNDDGTSEVVKTSFVSENGVVLTLSDGETVKLIDNSKSFADVPDSFWGADEVAFVSSRELFNGTGKGAFTPNAAMNRAMIVTVLARLDGEDTDEGESWYSAGVQWAVDSGISDGSALDQPLTREQLATMLYRYAQLRGCDVSAGEDADILGFTDAGSISEYAVPAMQWACAVGILEGRDGNRLAPTDGATRAEVAAMLQRFVSTL